MHRFPRLFSGRISREQFVHGFVTLIASIAAISFIAGIIAGSAEYSGIAILAFCIIALAIVIGGVFILGLSVRRIHDLGKSGWYAILLFISPINIIGLIILSVERGNREANEYGIVPQQRPLLAVLANTPAEPVS